MSINISQLVKDFNSFSVMVTGGQPLQGEFGPFYLAMHPINDPTNEKVLYHVIARHGFTSDSKRFLDVVRMCATSFVTRDVAITTLRNGEAKIELERNCHHLLRMEHILRMPDEESIAQFLSRKLSLIQVRPESVGDNLIVRDNVLVGGISIKPTRGHEGLYTLSVRSNELYHATVHLLGLGNKVDKTLMLHHRKPFASFQKIPEGIYRIRIAPL